MLSYHFRAQSRMNVSQLTTTTLQISADTENRKTDRRLLGTRSDISRCQWVILHNTTSHLFSRLLLSQHFGLSHWPCLQATTIKQFFWTQSSNFSEAHSFTHKKIAFVQSSSSLFLTTQIHQLQFKCIQIVKYKEYSSDNLIYKETVLIAFFSRSIKEKRKENTESDRSFVLSNICECSRTITQISCDFKSHGTSPRQN